MHPTPTSGRKSGTPCIRRASCSRVPFLVIAMIPSRVLNQGLDMMKREMGPRDPPYARYILPSFCGECNTPLFFETSLVQCRSSVVNGSSNPIRYSVQRHGQMVPTAPRPPVPSGDILGEASRSWWRARASSPSPIQKTSTGQNLKRSKNFDEISLSLVPKLLSSRSAARHSRRIWKV